mmetsp:Transcript_13246/g.37418  ORF Transcript_13246/g.37418 Transcript_13246/m.37418 type:complete len:433 (-) Transcript_13246:4693-5991(-)
MKLCHVGPQRLEAWEGDLEPQSRNLAVEKRHAHGVQVCAHQGEALHCLAQVHQGCADPRQQGVDAAELLDQDGVHGVVVVLRVLPGHRLGVKVVRQVGKHVGGHLAYDLLRALPASAGVAALRQQQAVQQDVGLLDILRHVGVCVQAKHLRLCNQRQGVYVFEVALELAVGGGVVGATVRQLVVVVQDVRHVVRLQDRHERVAVMAICHLATIVALAAGVAQRVVRDIRELVQEHLQLPDADAQVVLVELVRDVPANWPKLPSLLHDGVEEGKPKHELPELSILRTRVEELRVAHWVRLEGSEKAGPQPLGWLICDLDTVLQDRNREDIGGVGGQPEAELLVGVLRDELLLAVELQLRQEALGEVAVLQHHPEALLHALAQPLLCHRPLSLPQTHALHTDLPVICKLEQRCHGIRARRKHKHQRRCGRGVIV